MGSWGNYWIGGGKAKSSLSEARAMVDYASTKFKGMARMGKSMKLPRLHKEENLGVLNTQCCG